MQVMITNCTTFLYNADIMQHIKIVNEVRIIKGFIKQRCQPG